MTLDEFVQQFLGKKVTVTVEDAPIPVIPPDPGPPVVVNPPPPPPPPPPPTGTGTVYDIGADQPLKNLGDLTWAGLKPGDTVNVHWRPDPYRERVVLSARDTADQPITVQGIPGPNGELPLILGTNATTHPQFKLSYVPFQELALFLVHADSSQPRPGGIIIDGLAFEGATADQGDTSFTGQDGDTRHWSPDACGLYLSTFDNVTVRNCRMRNNGNGVFTHDGRPCNDLRLIGNTIDGNGHVGDNHQHGAYIQCVRPLYLGNTFGPMRPGSGGNCLKDRSADVIISGNVISAGQRQIDLSSWQNETADRAAAPNAGRTIVTNNVILNGPGCGHVVYVEGGRGAGQTVQFDRNTVRVRRDQSEMYYLRLFWAEYDVGVAFLADHNLIDVNPLTANGTPTEFRMFDSYGTLTLGPTWTRRPVSYFTGVALGKSVVSVTGDVVVGAADPGYVDEANGNYKLAPGAPAAGFGIG